jgi:hypothetical protein
MHVGIAHLLDDGVQRRESSLREGNLRVEQHTR